MSCRIEFTDPSVYGPGNAIKGIAHCQFFATEYFKAIKCVLQGIEKTSWTTTVSEYDSFSKKHKTRTVYHSGENTFIYAEGILVNEGQLPPGQYQYPFTFNLPNTMPSSFEGTYGSVKYHLNLYVDKGERNFYGFEAIIPVMSPINLNSIREQLFLQPTSYQDEKTVCCCCCASDPITLDVLMEKHAFAAGEKAKVTIKLVNMSNTSIPRIDLTLNQTVEYRSNMGSTIPNQEELGVYNSSGVGAHGDRTYQFEVEIPNSLRIPNFTGCALFTSYAWIVVKAVIPGFHSNLYVQTGVIKLGHIPLSDDPTESSKLLGSDVNPPPYPADAGTSSMAMPTDFPASAPKEEEAPSAPSKADMAEKGTDDIEILEDDHLLPPSYNESKKESSVKPPINKFI